MGILNFIRQLWNTPPRNSIRHRRSYNGARRDRTMADWLAVGNSANSEIWSSLATLRNRSRDLCRNNDYARGILRTLTDNVVYTGISFQAQVRQVKDPTKSNDIANDEIEAAWKAWTEKPEWCDVTGGQNFAELQQLAFRSCLESGEVFVRLVDRTFANSPIPFAIEVIESDRLADDHNNFYGGNRIVMGVEIDSWNRPVAYWFYKDHPGEMWRKDADRTLERVPAEEIIHLYQRERQGQLRGVPLLYSTIERMRNLGEYERSELIATRAASNYLGIITSEFNDLLSEPDLNGDEQILPEGEELEPGVLRRLFPGEKFESFSPNRPNTAFGTFIEAQLRGTGAGVGASYENVSNDYSKSNYSSSRLSLLQVRDRYKVLQEWFVRSVNQRVYERWLDAAVLAGVLRFSDYWLRPQRYQQVRWQPRGWSWVDPYKEINASVVAIDRGLTTLTAEIAKQGGDFEENIKIKAREREICAKYGVTLGLSGDDEVDSEAITND